MIKMLVLDVDGTLTDGAINMTPQGELFKRFSVKDGQGIMNLHQAGVIPVILTGRSSLIVSKRAEELRINEVYQGIKDKAATLKEIAARLKIKFAEIAYMGDDLNDAECIQLVGYAGAPKDAHIEILTMVDYVSSKNGGDGAVREFIDHLINDLELNPN